jgi:predicted negative regulator of RcsB-dependent stress response
VTAVLTHQPLWRFRIVRQGDPEYAFSPMGESADRVRTLLLRGDNLLKKGKVAGARTAFEEALAVAEDPRLRELAERRLRELQAS